MHIHLSSKFIHLLLTVLSGILGLFLLIGSSILIIDMVRNDDCDNNKNPITMDDPSSTWPQPLAYKPDTPGICKDGMIAVVSIGVIVSVVQAVWCGGVFIMHRLGAPDKIWQYLHVAYCILIILAFSLAIDLLGSWNGWKYHLFKAVAAIDWIFCLIATITVRFFVK